MAYDIDIYLEDVERRIDEEQEQCLLEQWRSFADGHWVDGVFCPSRRKATASGIDWPIVSTNDAIEDYDLMILQQFKQVSDALADNTNSVLNVRCNYGTGILPTIFGCEPMWMADELETLPCARSLADLQSVKNALEGGVGDLTKGFGEQVFNMGEKFLEIFERYPKINRYVDLWVPDIQGPIDALELIWGSNLFYAFYDEPEYVIEALDVVTETYCKFVDEWIELVGMNDDYTNYFGWLLRGKIMVREDSLVNLSPEIYEDLIMPFDQLILNKYKGGIHFCGKADHHIKLLASLSGLEAIQMTQPHLNNMSEIFGHTINKGINLIGLPIEPGDIENQINKNLIHCLGEV